MTSLNKGTGVNVFVPKINNLKDNQVNKFVYNT